MKKLIGLFLLILLSGCCQLSEKKLPNNRNRLPDSKIEILIEGRTANPNIQKYLLWCLERDRREREDK